MNIQQSVKQYLADNILMDGTRVTGASMAARIRRSLSFVAGSCE